MALINRSLAGWQTVRAWDEKSKSSRKTTISAVHKAMRFFDAEDRDCKLSVQPCRISNTSTMTALSQNAPKGSSITAKPSALTTASRFQDKVLYRDIHLWSVLTVTRRMGPLH